MALGNPLLATYAGDDLVRTYELTGGNVLTPLGVSDAFDHQPSQPAIDTNNILPGLGWFRDDNILVIEHGPNGPNSGNVVRALNSSCAQLATITTSAGSEIVGGIWRKFRNMFGMLFRPSTSIHAGAEFITVASNGGLSTTNFVLQGLQRSGAVADFVMSPNGNFAITSGSTSGSAYVPMNAAPGSPNPTFGAQSEIPIGIDPECAVISGDNNTVAFFSKNDRLAVVHQFNAGAWPKRQDLPLPAAGAGAIWNAIGSPDGLFMVVVFKQGTVYTTRIYKRIAGFFTVVQDIANFGQALGFTSDGVILVDGASKRGFQKNNETGEFDEIVGIGANLASNILRVEFSDAPVYPVAVTTVYKSVLKDIADGTIDLQDLYITLLTQNAVFDENDEDIEDVTGVNEVTGGSWPAGGVPLENVSAGFSGDVYRIASDGIDWVTFGSSLTTRYAVIYDHSTGQPIVWYDFFANRIVPTNRSMILNFPDDVVLRISR